MSLFSKLFGKRDGGSAPAATAPPEVYEGFTITPIPEAQGRQFRIGARIEKEVDGEMRSHHLIRADMIEGREAAEAASLGKARQMIDEQGDRLFGR